jgi:hypothetical protein
MRQLRALLAASFLICFLLTPSATAQDQTLQVGTPLDRQLAGGQSHTFSISVEENMFVQFVVEQRGIDVVVKLSDPDGKSLSTTDTPNGANGPENVSFVATATGKYRITVTPLDKNAGEGQYQIKIIEVREATEQELKTSKNMEGIKEKGIALLGEAENLIHEIRTPQTRIKAQVQASQMLWELDQKRAFKFLNDAATGLTEFIAALEPGDQNYMIEYAGIIQLRQEILQSLATHDPDAAINFLQASKLPGNPYGNQREQDMQDSALELMVVDNMVAKDPKRAFELARRKLKSGYSTSFINTIVTMKQKNPELASQLANELVGKLLQEKLLKKPEAAMLSVGLLHTCRITDKNDESSGGRGAVLTTERLISEDACRNLFQKALEEALSFSPPAPTVYSPDREAAWGLLSGLQQLGPELNQEASALASIEKKVGELTGGGGPYATVIPPLGGPASVQTDGSIEKVVESIEAAPEEAREHLYVQAAMSAASRGDGAEARKILNEHVTNPYQRRQALASLEQQEMYQSMSQGKVEDALKAVSALRTPRERANMLMQIARQIGPGHKSAAALNLLEQARSMVAPGMQAQDQEQMSALLEIARAFARYDTKRAFDILDPLVDQFNDLGAAARVLQGFGVEYYKNDELELITGNNLSALAANISLALATLAMANFERAKLTADRLRMPEVRLRAYLEIAQQAITGGKRAPSEAEYQFYSPNAVYLNNLNR